MKIIEFHKKAGFLRKEEGLGVTLQVNSADALQREFRHIKEAIVSWHERHGKNCKTVFLTVLAPVDFHAQIKEFVALVRSDEETLAPLLQRWHFVLALMDEAGSPIDEMTF